MLWYYYYGHKMVIRFAQGMMQGENQPPISPSILFIPTLYISSAPLASMETSTEILDGMLVSLYNYHMI